MVPRSSVKGSSVVGRSSRVDQSVVYVLFLTVVLSDKEMIWASSEADRMRSVVSAVEPAAVAAAVTCFFCAMLYC
jgi:hypothetical protein